MTHSAETVERMARGLWSEIGTDYTYDEAVARRDGLRGNGATPEHCARYINYAHDLARAALDAMPAMRLTHEAVEASNMTLFGCADRGDPCFGAAPVTFSPIEPSPVSVQDAARVLLESHEHMERLQALLEHRVMCTPTISAALRSALRALTKDQTCRKCGCEMQGGKALTQTLVAGEPDFPGDAAVTFSVGGPGRLIDCMKCVTCGWSVTEDQT